MVKYICALLQLCSLFLFVFASYLDIDELNEMKYSMDILYKPIQEDDISSTGIKLKTVHGQKYFCKLPEVKEKLNSEGNGFNNVVEFPTPLLLTPIKHEGCMTVVKGWWTYKLCIGGSIQQFHSEDGIKMGDLIELGDFRSDFDWEVEGKLKSSKFKQHKLKKYHSQYYDNGTRCELLDLRRKTEVRYFCEESAGSAYIERVDEPITCSYIISVRSRELCAHPYFKEEQNRDNHLDITCQPILTALEYDKFNEKNVKPVIESIKKENNDIFHLDSHLQPVLDIKFFKDIRETAIYFIKRFVNEDRLDKLSTKQQHELVSLVVEHFDTFKDLPTADKARLIQIEIETFLLQQDFLNSNPMSSLLSDLGNLNKNSQPNLVNNVNIEFYNSNNMDDLEDNIQDEGLEELENELKIELENAGVVDANIKVHFISSKNNEKSKLTSVEATQFKELLMDIVGSSMKEQSEKVKYQNLNKNYNMVFVDGDFKNIEEKKES